MATLAALLYDGCRVSELSEYISVFNNPHHEFHIIDCSAEPSGTISSDEGLELNIRNRLSDYADTTFDCIAVTGGDVKSAVSNAELFEFLTRHHKIGTAVGGICNGVWILAASGLLKGRRTTHTAHESCNAPAEIIETASEYFDGSQYVEENLVVDGNIVCAKPWAKIDFTCALAGHAGLVPEAELGEFKNYLIGDFTLSGRPERQS